MPIPDTIMAEQPEKTKEQELNEKAPVVIQTVNSYLRKCAVCRNDCMACIDECQEFKEWEKLSE